MTASNTHSRGRHSSSISFVDDAGKYLGESQEHAERAQVDADQRARGKWRHETNPPTQSDLQAVATNHRLNYTTAGDETYSLQFLIKAFKMWSSELKTSRERRVRECVSA